jgi:hypothetical protein
MLSPFISMATIQSSVSKIHPQGPRRVKTLKPLKLEHALCLSRNVVFPQAE